MIFCDNSDLYISLYIDDQLEQDEKEKFLKHLGECPQCARKLEEESYFIKLINDEEALALPDDFSASLHSKLIEVNKKVNNNRSKFLIINKKVMATLSTAAIVVISVLAFKLLPASWSGMDKTSFSKSEVSQGAADTADKNEKPSNKKSAQDSESSTPRATKEEGGGIAADTDSSAADQAIWNEAASRDEVKYGTKSSADKSQIIKDYKVKASVKADKANKADKTDKTDKSKKTGKIYPEENSDNSAVARNNGNRAAGADSESQQKVAFAIAGSVDDKKMFYYKNYAEYDLTVSAMGTDMEKLDKFMLEQGAEEQGAGLMRGFTANREETVAYRDYNMPLSAYGSLKSEALLKYELQLIAKTDIIKTDITQEYNDLEKQKSNIEKKIDKALAKGQDTTDLEAEKASLLEQISKLSAEGDMISIRIFFVYN